MLFLAGIFGGIGLGTVLGFLVGAWCQRKLRLETVVAQEARKARESIEKIMGEEDEESEPKGLGHPSGAVPPTHDAARTGKKRRLHDLFQKMGAR